MNLIIIIPVCGVNVMPSLINLEIRNRLTGQHTQKEIEKAKKTVDIEYIK